MGLKLLKLLEQPVAEQLGPQDLGQFQRAVSICTPPFSYILDSAGDVACLTMTHLGRAEGKQMLDSYSPFLRNGINSLMKRSDNNAV